MSSEKKSDMPAGMVSRQTVQAVVESLAQESLAAIGMAAVSGYSVVHIAPHGLYRCVDPDGVAFGVYSDNMEAWRNIVENMLSCSHKEGDPCRNQ